MIEAYEILLGQSLYSLTLSLLVLGVMYVCVYITSFGRYVGGYKGYKGRFSNCQIHKAQTKNDFEKISRGIQ